MRVAGWLLVLASCASTTALVPSGAFPLVAVNGRELPATISPLPARDGSPAVCSLQYDRGELRLDDSAATFELSYRGVDSCSGRTLSTQRATGRYSRSGDRLMFSVGGGGRLEGRVVNDQLVIWDEGLALVFQIR